MEQQRPMNIAKFLNREGRVVQLPRPARTLGPVLAYLASKLEPQRSYTEKELNQALAPWHAFAHGDEVRRSLVDWGLLWRRVDGSEYRLSEQQPAPWVWKQKWAQMEGREE